MTDTQADAARAGIAMAVSYIRSERYEEAVDILEATLGNMKVDDPSTPEPLEEKK